MLFALCLCSASVLTSTAGSSSDWARSQSELVALLQQLIQTDTQNPPGNELAACRVLQHYFKKHDIECRLFKVGEGRANLLARLPGDGSQKPILLVAHTDVVPVDTTTWTVAPFSGKIQDGFLYGRGALDDKGMLAVEAVTLALLKEREREFGELRRDVILLATAGEETGGSVGVGWMLERHSEELDAAFALSEGGRISLRNGKPLYVGVQIQEKVAYNIRLVARGTSGHASVSRLDNAIFALARALERLERYPTPIIINPIAEAFFRSVAPLDSRIQWHGGNIWTSDPLYLSLLTNTISPTLLEGGIKSNVLPEYAAVNLNCRLLPEQDVDAFVDSLAVWVAPGPYYLEYKKRSPPPPASPMDGVGFLLIEQVCGQLFPEAPVVPYLSPGMSDGSRLRAAGIPTYGLLPFPLDEGEAARLHAADERISLEALYQGLELIYRLAELAGR
ncbi:MAG: M20/M25/M40 family metallo-hydrolase [bacterium]